MVKSFYFVTSQPSRVNPSPAGGRRWPVGPECARHGTVLGGGSPLSAVEIGRTSLGKGVHREVESEGS